MRHSSLRLAYPLIKRITVLSLLLGILIATARSNAAEQPQVENHPFAVVALASIDRVRARAASLGEAIGSPEFGDKIVSQFLGGDDEMNKLFNSPGFDTTRPIGIMSYPKWFSGEVEETADSEDKEGILSDSVDLTSWSDLFDDPFSFLAGGIMENATIAMCIPAKDREQLLAAISEMASEKFTPVAGHPGWFEPEGGKDLRVMFVGRYLLLVIDEGKVKQWDRNYPDFEKLARASLGQNGFAYSLYRRGLPKLVREDMAEAFKLAHAATLQRQDNEPEAAFKFRTMFGPLMTESLDLLLSQIEEFRITGHVDSNTHQIIVDTELIGPKDGKLAKLANGLTTKSSLFGNLSTDGAIFAATVSLPLSPKLWKPVAETLRTIGESDQQFTWLPEIARTLAKTIEVGQLELHASYARDGEGLFALRVAGNDKFPEQIQAALESFAKLHDDAIHVGTVKLAVDSIEGWPVHRVRASILDHVELGDFGWSNLTPNDARPVATAKFTRTTEDGKVVTGTTAMRVPAAEGEPQNYVWVVATPSGLWLALSSPDKREFPEWCRSAVAASLAKPTTTATANRNNAPVRVLLRGLGASPPATDSANENPRDAKVTQAAAKGADQGEKFVVDVDLAGAESNDIVAGRPKTRKATAEEIAAAKAQHERAEQRERERGDLLRDGSNAIRVELRLTASGLRLRTTFDDAYFHWFATMMKHSLDEMESAVPPAFVEPAPPPKQID